MPIASGLLGVVQSALKALLVVDALLKRLNSSERLTSNSVRNSQPSTRTI
jgi:hypothetical protein